MKSARTSRKATLRKRIVRRFWGAPAGALFALLALLLPAPADSPVPTNKPPNYPFWWFTYDVIVRANPDNLTPAYPADYSHPPADLSPITQGQLKNFALAAYNELQAYYPGGAGPEVTQLLQNWLQTDPTTGEFLLDTNGRPLEKVTLGAGANSTNDGLLATLGQLKAVAQPFYDQLIAASFRPAYPWTGSSHAPADLSLASIGQVKSVFSFDLSIDSGNNGYPDFWADYYGLNLLGGTGGGSGSGTGAGPNDDPDQDGLTNLQEYQLGTNPLKKDNPRVQLSAFGYTAP